MKRTIKNYGIAIISILFLSFLTSLILSFLDISEMMKIDINILTYTLSYVFYAISSFILGLKMKKRGLLNGCIFFAILFLISFIFSESISLLHTLVKFIIIIFFTIFGVNKKNS